MRPDTYSARAPDRAHWPWLLVVLITIYTAVLLSSLFSSEALLRDAIDRRLLADGTHSAAQVADFLAGRQRDVMASAESRAINDYLVNRALGMSERYGLNFSLDDIDRHLASEIQNTRLRSRQVFSAMAFFDERGQQVAAAGELDAAVVAGGEQSAAGFEIIADRQLFRVRAPVIFRGEFRGSVVAVGSLECVAAALIDDALAAGGHYLKLLVGADGRLVSGVVTDVGSGQGVELDPAFVHGLVTLPEGRIMPAAAPGSAALMDAPLLALRSPVGATSLSVLILGTEAEVHGQVASPLFLLGLAVFPLALALGVFAFVRLSRHAEHLQGDKEALAAEVGRRELAEASLKQKADALLRSNAELEQLAMVFTHAREGVSITDASGSILRVNDAFCRLSGYSREELIGRNPRILSSGRQSAEFYAQMWTALLVQGHWSGEIWNRRKNGELFVEQLTISAVCDSAGQALRYVGLFTDITAQKAHQRQLEQMAHYDALTELPNRSLLADRLQQGMAQALRREARLAVVALDLDGFKSINDRYGHDAGDRLLVAVSGRMNDVLREGDTLARIGGDEFVAVMVDLPEIGSCLPLLERLLEAAAEEVAIDDYRMQVSASLGVTFYPQDEVIDADQLLRQADQAMYEAKLLGKDRYHLFDAAQDRVVRGRHESLERIRKALEQDEFVLHYQPKVNMRSGRMVGVEALIRWQHPELGLLAPIEFLPLVENHPFAVELGDWVIDTALAQIAYWRACGLELAVSVNVGARQLQQKDFVARLRARLAARPEVPSGLLELEVLETSALEDIDQVSRVIKDCLELGVRFALDDFGTGYSSLTYLKRLPAQTLKIDRSFVRDMLHDRDDLAILKGVLGLAAAFRRQPLAEGVETAAHGELLLDLGCELAQGYHIAHPMPAVAIIPWVTTWMPGPTWLDRPRKSPEDLPILVAMVQHRAWVAQLEAIVLAEDEGALDTSLNCSFGAWLRREGQANLVLRQAFDVIVTRHDEMHALAEAILGWQKEGRQAEALAALPRFRALEASLVDAFEQFSRARRPH